MEAHEKRYERGETLLIAGSVTERMGLVLESSVTIESNDASGNRTIISRVGRGRVEPMRTDSTSRAVITSTRTTAAALPMNVSKRGGIFML